MCKVRQVIAIISTELMMNKVLLQFYSSTNIREANQYSTNTKVWDMVDWTGSKNQEEVWDQWEQMGTMQANH